MQLIFKHAYLLFIIFFVAALIAFWPGYFRNIFSQSDNLLHFHGLPMTLWCLLLITQALAIKFNKYKLHKKMGLLVYVLIPVICLTTYNLVVDRIGGPGPIGNMRMYSLALMLNATIAFFIITTLAMLTKNKPAYHSRFMVASIFPLMSPVTDRIIYRNFPELLQHAPTIDGYPIAPYLGFVLADVILIALAAWGLFSRKRNYAFLISLSILIIYHFSVMHFYKFDFWKNFAVWFFR